MLVGMETGNMSRTEFVIQSSLKNDFPNIELSTVNLAETLLYEGSLVANEYLYNQYHKVKPDIVLYSGVEALEPTIFEECKNAKQIIWFYDAPFHVDVCKRGNLVDHLFITANGLVDDYKHWGVDCHWLLEGVCNPPHFRAEDVVSNFAVDIAFVGSPDMQRNALLNQICAEVPATMGIWGSKSGPPYFGLDDYCWDESLPYKSSYVTGNEYPAMCHSAKIVLGINVYNDIYQYFSNRNLFTMGCGGFLLTHYVPGLEELFVNHQHLVWYKDFDEACDLLKHYLDPQQDDKRKEIKNNAYQYAYNNFSMTQQLKRMFHICDISYK